jgi:hypothetical protein
MPSITKRRTHFLTLGIAVLAAVISSKHRCRSLTVRCPGEPRAK